MASIHDNRHTNNWPIWPLSFCDLNSRLLQNNDEKEEVRGRRCSQPLHPCCSLSNHCCSQIYYKNGISTAKKAALQLGIKCRRKSFECRNRRRNMSNYRTSSSSTSIVGWLLIGCLMIATTGKCANGMSMDHSMGGGGMAVLGDDGLSNGGLVVNDNLEKSIAAVFNKVAYGSTTTKRSIPDNVFVPSLTTVPTPPLTTFR